MLMWMSDAEKYFTPQFHYYLFTLLANTDTINHKVATVNIQEVASG